MQVVPDAALDMRVLVAADEFLRIGLGVRVWRTIRVIFEGEGGIAVALQEKVKGNAAEMEFAGTGPDEFREFIRSEFALWQRVLRATRIEAQ